MEPSLFMYCVKCARKIFQKYFRFSLAVFFSAACVISYAESSNSVGSTGPGAPDDKALDILLGETQFEFVDDYYPLTLVSDRIMDGFQAAPRWLRVDKDTTIFWGFKYKEATIESIVISVNGRVLLAGAISNIASLARASDVIISTDEEYYEKNKSIRVDPSSVTLFVRGKDDLVNYLPFVKRWLQADLLGMNVDCDSQEKIAACKFAEGVQIPIVAYQIQISRAEKIQLNLLSIPDLKASDTPIKWFTQ